MGNFVAQNAVPPRQYAWSNVKEDVIDPTARINVYIMYNIQFMKLPVISSISKLLGIPTNQGYVTNLQSPECKKLVYNDKMTRFDF